MGWNDQREFSVLLGKTLSDVSVNGVEEIIFTIDNGTRYRMFHEQDCCEYVEINDIC